MPLVASESYVWCVPAPSSLGPPEALSRWCLFWERWVEKLMWREPVTDIAEWGEESPYPSLSLGGMFQSHWHSMWASAHFFIVVLTKTQSHETAEAAPLVRSESEHSLSVYSWPALGVPAPNTWITPSHPPGTWGSYRVCSVSGWSWWVSTQGWKVSAK